jgi:AcrR family transcriptional regulator
MGSAKLKYNSIRKIAGELFWKHGFKRVSVEEICRKANVSKMTFYKYFPNKTELAKKIYSDIVADAENRFREIMDSDASPAEKIKEVIRMKFEGTMNISPEFMADFYTGSDSELISFVRERTQEILTVLRTDYIRAQEKGIFRKDFNVDLLIKMQAKMTELMDDESLTVLYGSRQELIMEFAKLLVYGIAAHGQE